MTFPEPSFRCQECGDAAPPDALRWRAEIANDLEDGDPPAVALYCPACWLLEFGDGGQASGQRPR
jgi:hypothetical protein